MPEDEVLTAKELAQYLKLPESTVRQLVREGRIPGVKVGRSWRFHKAAIDTWLAGQHGQQADGNRPRGGEAE